MRLRGKSRGYRSHLLAYFMAFIAIFITIAMVQYPKDAFDSAIMGLNLWWNVVFPSLLPFFILSEILMGLGVVHFIGILLEPLMRPIFNVPGVGAFSLYHTCHSQIKESVPKLTPKQEGLVNILIGVLKRLKIKAKNEKNP